MTRESTLRRGSGLIAAVAISATALVAGLMVSGPVSALGMGAPAATAAETPKELPKPPEYWSVNGELHLKVVAKKVKGTIGDETFTDLLTYDTSIVDGKGRFVPGTTSPYIGPTWHVNRGDKITIEYVNNLPTYTFNPVQKPDAERVPSFQVPQPLSLHFHGLMAWPGGNADNVLLSIPPKRSNHYEVTIAEGQDEGLYWYHPHIHGLADAQVYNGLAGFLVIGRSDGNYANFDDLIMREMALRYNVEFPNPYNGELIDANAVETTGTALAPRGQMIYTVNGALDPQVRLNAADPDKGLPAESQIWSMANITGSATYIVAVDEVDAADAQDPDVVGTPRDLVLVSIDGQYMPAPIVKTGQEAARGYLIPQGGRVALLVQGPSAPGKVVRLLQLENRSGTGLRSAYDWQQQTYIGGWRDYTRDIMLSTYSDYSVETSNVPTPATLTPNYDPGDEDLSRAPVAEKRTFIYNNVSDPTIDNPNNFGIDFQLYPNAPIAQPRIGTVEEWTVYNFSPLLHPFHAHVQDAQVMEVYSPVNEDFVNPEGEYPSAQYVTDMNQPEHSLFQQDVINIPPAFVSDANGGMPAMSAKDVPIKPGKIVLRVRINDYLGWYVQHCHRLPHEDRGMMSIIRTIPTDPLVATATKARSARVTVRSSLTWEPKLRVTPFPGVSRVSVAVGDTNFDTRADVAVAAASDGKTRVKVYLRGQDDDVRTYGPFAGLGNAPSVALTDMNGDNVDDIIVGAGRGATPRVRVIDAVSGKQIGTFLAYDADFRGGVSVAGGTLEEGGRNSIVTGSGPGMRSSISIFNNDLFGDAKGNRASAKQVGTFRKVATFKVGPKGDTSGASVAVGTPRAALGGLSSIVVTAGGTLQILNVKGHHGGGGHDHHGDLGFTETVSETGVHLALPYDPFSPRMVTSVYSKQLARLGYDDGARVGVVSTPLGARMLLTPRRGNGDVTAVTLGPNGKRVAAKDVIQRNGAQSAGM